MKLSQHSDIRIVWYGFPPNAGAVLLQNIHAEIINFYFILVSFVFIALSSYLTTPANFTIVYII